MDFNGKRGGKMTHSELLNKIYASALMTAFGDKGKFDHLDADTRAYVDYIISRMGSNKAVLAVLVTLFAQKIITPAQDIRNHKSSMKKGFPGRTIDIAHVTPFMKKVSFPAMTETGWLTRSLGRADPYDLKYPGNITPKEMKDAFLNIIHSVQTEKTNPNDILLYMFVLLIRQRDGVRVDLAKPHSLSISAIINLLESHFTAAYASDASRLPVLAMCAAYKCLMPQSARYREKILHMEGIEPSEEQIVRLGDIDIYNPDNTAFECAEVKHGMKIIKSHITEAYEKFKIFNTNRYYLLTTASMEDADWKAIDEETARIAYIHGCQVIVGNIYDTLGHYLRLMNDTAEFVAHYVDCLKDDAAVKYQHKVAWNDVVAARG